MGLYESFVLPRLVHLSMQNKEATRYRQKVVPAATGRVLEVGIGSGLNLPFYSAAVTSLVGLDPSEPLLHMAGKAASSATFEVSLLSGTAERMEFDADSFDSVVSTWTLCSIHDPGRALAEVARVLEPGGSFIFIKHGLSPEPGVAAWQNRLTPYWRRCAGGCHLNRRIDQLVQASGLEITALDAGYMVKGPRPWTYNFQGRAQPA